MPKILLNIKVKEIDKTLAIFEKKELEKADFIELKSIFNNSIIGTSKLLHFMYPEKYPIWVQMFVDRFLEEVCIMKKSIM